MILYTTLLQDTNQSIFTGGIKFKYFSILITLLYITNEVNNSESSDEWSYKSDM